ncbi:MAG TPA: HIT family protein [Ktedonobacterales bacterium]|nr:HIT family protein [Ktedonobacterales bacterium]
MGLDADGAGQVAGCAFCLPERLDTILSETEHFRVVADFAPLVEGHTLIIPRQHFPCYGAVPLEYEAELVALKRRVARFFRERYRPPVFFEHGVFRQTVFHAHLHAFPLGAVNLRPFELAHPDGREVHTLADLRAWYEERGHYFYLEQPRADERPPEAAVFPPEEERYFTVLRSLRERTAAVGTFQPAAIRRLLAGPPVAALATAWREFERDAPPPAEAPAD